VLGADVGGVIFVGAHSLTQVKSLELIIIMIMIITLNSFCLCCRLAFTVNRRNMRFAIIECLLFLLIGISTSSGPYLDLFIVSSHTKGLTTM
jgi:hypothetical protein